MRRTSLALPEQESHSGDRKINRGDRATEHADMVYAACERGDFLVSFLKPVSLTFPETVIGVDLNRVIY